MPEMPSARAAKLSWVFGLALFAIFFGAGNLIFPPHLGRLAGDRYLSAGLGFLLADVGLIMLCLMAVARTGSGLDEWADRVSPRFSKILNTAILLIIGPLLAIPRTCATTYELAVMSNLPWLPVWVFSVLYFAATGYFLLDARSVIDKVGRFLAPLLLAALLVLIAKGILFPIGRPAETSLANPFGKGVAEGYQTMDALGAALTGLLVIARLKSVAGTGRGRLMRTVLTRSALIAGLLLSAAYGGLLYLGATSSAIPGARGHVEMLKWLSHQLFGGVGTLLLSAAVGIACLTTSIGLSAMAGEYFSKVSRKKLSYRRVVFAILVVSAVISNLGVARIINFAVPILLFVYPAVITLVTLAFARGAAAHRAVWRWAVAGSLAGGLLDSAAYVARHARNVYPPAAGQWIETVHGWLPLAESGFAWIAPALGCALLGLAVALRRRRACRTEGEFLPEGKTAALR